MIEVFGARVRQARLLRRMTARSVVEATGWSTSRQSQIEKSLTVRLDDGDVLIVGELRIQALHTSDHTRRSDKISTLAAATLREPGFTRAVARAVALKVWRDAGYELES